jgi:uncharacterized protein YkwD
MGAKLTIVVIVVILVVITGMGQGFKNNNLDSEKTSKIQCGSGTILKNGICVLKTIQGPTVSETKSSTESDDKEKQTEKEIHRLVNIERKKYGLPTLSYDTKLSNIAKSHSEDMFEKGYFSHTTLEGKSPTDRGISKGYHCRIDVSSTRYYEGIAENIFKLQKSSISFWESPESIAENAVSGWMNSPGHKKNILSDISQKEGIGVKIGIFDIYVTQNFC